MRALSFTAVVFAMATAAAQDNSSRVSDVAIAARVETVFLLDRHLSPYNINTRVRDGVVTLSGAVRDDIQRELAEELAASSEGVVEVVNQIVVLEDAQTPGEKRTWKKRIGDRSVRASIRSRLLYHKSFKGLKISVRVRDGEATLSGVVPSEKHRQSIGEVAYQTRGVVSIVNSIRVLPREELEGGQAVGRNISDEWIEKRIETSIVFKRNLSIRRIDVEVNDRVALLTGVVDTETEKRLAERIANNIQGVRSVRNELKVRGRPTGDIEFLDALEPLEPLDEGPPGATPANPSPAPTRAPPKVVSSPLEAHTPPPD